MHKFLIVAILMSGVAAPAYARNISADRAAAIKHCHRLADAKYGPSGVRSWRRFNHDYYAACMANSGQPQ